MTITGFLHFPDPLLPIFSTLIMQNAVFCKNTVLNIRLRKHFR